MWAGRLAGGGGLIRDRARRNDYVLAITGLASPSGGAGFLFPRLCASLCFGHHRIHQESCQYAGGIHGKPSLREGYRHAARC